MNQNLPSRHDIPSFWQPMGSSAISLHLGENPFSPTPHVLDAMAKASPHANRYPDTNCITLREKLSDYVGMGVKKENIIVGNGSDELIDLAVVAFAERERPVAAFDPTFFVYGFAAQRHGIPFVSLHRDVSDMLPSSVAMQKKNIHSDIALTFIANPNNPTGMLTSREILMEYIHQWPGIVVVDECYYEFSNQTVLDLIHQSEKLIVLRSLSKSFGLSGLRVGYAVASETLIDMMERHAMTFPVNIIAQAAGIAALEDVAIYQGMIRQLIEEREKMACELSALGLKVYPSAANFILTVWPELWNAKNPAAMLAQRGILVSDQSATMCLEKPALRIAMGTKRENERVVQEIRQLLE